MPDMEDVCLDDSMTAALNDFSKAVSMSYNPFSARQMVYQTFGEYALPPASVIARLSQIILDAHRDGKAEGQRVTTECCHNAEQDAQNAVKLLANLRAAASYTA